MDVVGIENAFVDVVEGAEGVPKPDFPKAGAPKPDWPNAGCPNEVCPNVVVAGFAAEKPEEPKPEEPKVGAAVFGWDADPKFEKAPPDPAKFELPPPNAPNPFAGWKAVPPKAGVDCVVVAGCVPNDPNIVFVRPSETAEFELPSDRPPMVDSLSASAMSASGEAASAGGEGATGAGLLIGALEPNFEGCDENELNPKEGDPNDGVVEANAPNPVLAANGEGAALG